MGRRLRKSQKQRPVDTLIEGSWSALVQRFKLINSHQTAFWQALLIIVFIAGFVAALTWASANQRFTQTRAQQIISNTATATFSDGQTTLSTTSNTVTTTVGQGNNLPPNEPLNLTQRFDDTPGAEGALTTDTTPEFSFTISDPNQGQTIGYQIQIAKDKDFLDRVIDFTWEGSITNPNRVTFQVLPQEALVPSDYFWRTRGSDDRAAVSNWVYFGDRDSVDFTVQP